jgi:hypothetical protein
MLSQNWGIAELMALRTRLSRMSDAELKDFGRAMEFLASRRMATTKSPSNIYVIQLREARAEWSRRSAQKPALN